MNDEISSVLRELKAERVKIDELIERVQESRFAELRKELDEVAKSSSYSCSGGTPHASVRNQSKVHDKTVSKRLYTLKEAAQSLGMSTGTVRRLVDRGLLKPNRALRTLLFSATELDRFASEK